MVPPLEELGRPYSRPLSRRHFKWRCPNGARGSAWQRRAECLPGRRGAPESNMGRWFWLSFLFPARVRWTPQAGTH